MATAVAPIKNPLVTQERYVCANPGVIPVGVQLHATIQDAIDATEASYAFNTEITICPGTYAEALSIEITARRSIHFIGNGNVTITGTSSDSAIVELENACQGDDQCFGTVSFDGIDLNKVLNTQYPTSGILVENYSLDPEDETLRFDRASVTFGSGSISDLPTAIAILGKVNLTLTDADVFDNSGTGTATIFAEAGGEPVLDDPNHPQVTDYDLCPQILIENSSIRDNDQSMGSVLLSFGSWVELINSQVFANDGYSFYIEASYLSFEDSTVHHNNGTVLATDDTTTLDIESSSFYGNTSTYWGAFFNGQGNVHINNSWIFGNSALLGGGAYWYGDSLTSTGSCWFNNTPEDLYHHVSTQSHDITLCSDLTCDANSCW